MQRQPGDVFILNGHTYEQWRGGNLIDSRDLSQMTVIVLTQDDHFGASEVSTLYLEKNMPGQNVSCTGVTENQNTGAVTFKFSSGNNIEFADWAAVGQIADALDAGPEFAEKVLLLKAFRASSDGANKTTQVGASVSVNGLADVPVIYTEPE